MLKSRYHTVLLGMTPWSLLHALILRQQKYDVLVVDDRRLATDMPGTRWLNRVEITLLKSLGEKWRIAAFTGIESFLRPARLRVETSAGTWVGGPTVRDQLREYMRKFAFFGTPILHEALESGDLERDLDVAIQEFLDWFQSPAVRERSLPAYAGTPVPWISEFHRLVTQEASRPYQGPEVSAFAQFLTAFTFATDQVVKDRFLPHESWAMTLRLLSPLWELDRPWLERELTRELTLAGGHTKKAGIQSWQVYRGRVEAALLNSYEGVVSHERLLFHGFPPADGELQCRFAGRIFRGQEFTWGEDTLVTGEERVQLATFTQSKRLGTEIPGGFGEFIVGRGRWIVLVADALGSKPEFTQKAAWATVQEDAPAIFPKEGSPWEKARVRGSWGLWVEDRGLDVSGQGKLHHHQQRQVEIIDRIHQTSLQGVEFWGPLRPRYFGLLGLLADLHADRG